MSVSRPADPERRGRLLAAKLRALVKRGWPGLDLPEPAAGAGGVSAELDGRGFALIDDSDDVRGFARALLWGLHRQVRELHVMMDPGPEIPAAARQAACFTTPVTVWAVTGASLSPAAATPLAGEPRLDPRTERFRQVIADSGADVVVEWGVLSGEVLGLQVARVCTDPDRAWLELGIGKHDRLANRLLWGDEPSSEAVARVVAPALEARCSGDLDHPLNHLCRERWLRTVLRRRPQLAKLGELEPMAPPRALEDLRVPLVAPAAEVQCEGGPALVACSTGFDPTAVPMAAELHTARMPGDTPVVFVMPERDAHPLIRMALADSRIPAELRTVPDDWHAPPANNGSSRRRPPPDVPPRLAPSPGKPRRWHPEALTASSQNGQQCDVGLGQTTSE